VDKEGYERLRTILVVIGVIAISSLVWYVASEQTNYSVEAQLRTSVASDILSGQSRGRQALVKSLEYPPLPTVLISLLSLLPGLRGEPLTARIIAFGSLLLLSLYMFRLHRRYGIPRYIRIPALFTLILLPGINATMIQGTSALLLLCLLVPGAGFLYGWLEKERLHDLAFGAVLLGLSCLVAFQSLSLIAVCVPFVAIRSGLLRKKAVVEATLLVFLVPTLYAVVLWFGGNWLIMGDAMFHVKHWYGRAISHPAPLWVAFLGGFPWRTGAVTMGLFFVPLILCRRAQQRSYRAVVMRPLALTLIFALAWAGLEIGPERRPFVSREIEVFTGYLSKTYTSEAFVVVGYDGYEFLDCVDFDKRSVWKHVIRLDGGVIKKIVDDFQGRRVLLILPATPTAEFLTDISVDLRPYCPAIPSSLLLVERRGAWLIFECIANGKSAPYAVGTFERAGGTGGAWEHSCGGVTASLLRARG